MTPEGEIYFPDEVYKDDFSKSNASDRHFFIHEMVHVWQHQLKYPVKKKVYCYIQCVNLKVVIHIITH